MHESPHFAGFFVAPSRGHALEGESPLLARQGNSQPSGKGVRREAEFEGSRRQSAGPTNRNCIETFMREEKAIVAALAN